jgi:beta-N-acetylhexosaminidase
VLDSVVLAAETGRLPTDRLEQAARRVDDLSSWTRSRAVAADPDSGVGAEAAARSIELHGDVAVTTPVVLDLGGAVNIAAGRRGRHLLDALAERDRRTTVVEVDGDDPRAGLAAASGRDVVVVVRSPRDSRVRALLDGVLTARPDAVVVQTGLADETTATRLVRTRGGGRAVAVAAAALLLPDVAP